MLDNSINLTSAPHPFEAAGSTVPVPQGMSLAQMLEFAQPDPVLAAHAVAFIEGQPIDRRYWANVYPKAGTLVEIRVLPMGGGGGGKDTLRVVLQLAVLVAAATVPGLQSLALTAGQQALLQAGIAVVGNLAINALVPVQGPSAQSSPINAFDITGFQNQARPFEPIPQILGRRRVFPDYGTRPFTEIVGKDQYIRAVFVWGIGPLQIDVSSLRIGETAITDFEGVELEHRAGFPDDAPRKLYSNTVFQTDLRVRLGGITDGVDETTGEQIRTADAGADELSVDVTFPAGIIGVGKKTGDEFALSVPVRIKYRAVGDTTWLTPTFTAKTFPDDWVVGNVITFTGKQKGAVRHGMTWTVPATGQYEVSLERLPKAAGDGNNTDETFWTALRSIAEQDPISSRVPVATTTVRIKASDQLNGTLDSFNGIVTTVGRDWNGASWDNNVPITNPASLFRHVLQGAANAFPLETNRIDRPSLQDWHEFNSAKGFTCSTVVRSGSSVWSVLAQVAACGRAAPASLDGGWGVVVDRPQAVPVSHITPRNSFNFQAEKAFIELPHAFRIPFANEDEDWRQDERRVYRSGFDKTNATKFEELPLPGITDPDQIELMGRYRMAQGIHQPERWTFNQDMEFLTYKRGDRVKITHDVLLVGLHSGRIKGVTVDGGNNVTHIDLDETVTMEEGVSYSVSIRTLHAQIFRGIITVAGDRDRLLLSTSIPPVGGEPAVRRHDIFGFGIFGLETDDAQIISIRPNSSSDATITAVPYREVIYDGDDTAIPPFETNITPRVALPAPVVRDVISDGRVVATDGSGNIRIRVAFDVDPLPDTSDFTGARLQVQQRVSGLGVQYVNSTVDERTEGRVLVSGVFEGDVLDFRLRWVPDTGLSVGPWVEVLGHEIAGRTLSAPDITVAPATFAASSGGAERPGILLTWENAAPPGVDTLAYQIRIVPSDGGVSRATVDVTEEREEIHDVLPGQPYELRARYKTRVVAWSDWIPVTTPDLRLTQSDLADALRDQIDTAFDRHDQALSTVDRGTVFELLNRVRIEDAILAAQNVISMAHSVVEREQTEEAFAAIIEEQTTRETADSAFAQQMTAVIAGIDDNAAAIVTETTARTTGDSALAQQLTAVIADVGENSAVIASEITARITGDVALGQQINTLFTEVGDNAAAITSETTARTSADASMATQIDNVIAEVGDNAAAISAETTARAAGDSAIASSVTGLTARVGTAEGNITTLQSTKVTAAGAVSAVNQTISASYGSMTALAQATAFAEATVDGIASGFVWKLGGSDVLSLVRVDDGVTAPVTTARIKGDYIKLDGTVQVTGDFVLDGDLILGGSLISSKFQTNATGMISVDTRGFDTGGLGTTWASVLTHTASHASAATERNLILFCRIQLQGAAAAAGNVLEYRILRNGALMENVPPLKRDVRPGEAAQEFFGLKQRTSPGATSTTYVLQARVAANGAGIAVVTINAGTQMWTEEARIAALV